MDKRTIGKDVEDRAWHWLIKKGLRPVKRNYFCKMGEIDLILLESNVLVFTEVRYRKNKQFGGAALSVTPNKQNKLIKAAQHFLMTHPSFQNYNCRFDVLAYESSPEDSQPIWYKDAFRL
ncbi:YraN family protein [Neptunomonas phycophila]|uniref:YraN family protein n=1 Tax=Neptunomonas phycophila TaxID=1572645 RepID=UPI003519CDB0